MFRALVLIFVGLFLSGCATTSIENGFNFLDSDQGIVVFSVTNDIGGGLHNNKAIFYMNHKENKNYRQLESTQEVFPGGWYKPSEFGKVQGRLFAITLPAGTHKLSTWKIFSSAGVFISPRVDPNPLSFEVAQGEIKYIGGFHMNLRAGKNFLGMTIVADGYPEILDRSERDIPMFEKRYPQFEGVIKSEILKIGPWPNGATAN
ncbi:MAG: hypothetical protein COB51_12795 [Moraxellaceae bacterium]|nr:MAG: hypothetical protein COB51_12795 [Moraxellaceae bacterium]